jgi:large subunit ribosomal protein L20
MTRDACKKAGVDINRQILADLAVRDEKAFADLAQMAKSRQA